MKRAEACSKCKIRPIRAPNQRYCKECHANNAKENRRRTKLKMQNLEREVRKLRLSVPRGIIPVEQQ